MKKIKNIIKVVIIIIIVLSSIFLIIKGIDYAKNANNSYGDDKLKKTENKVKKKSSDNTDISNKNIEESNINNNSNTNTTTNTTSKKNNSTTNNTTSTTSKKRLVTTDPIYEYSCPDGKPAKYGDKCNVKATVDADKKYYCNEGTLENDKCKIGDTYINANYTYVCPSSAYTLIDNKCERSEQRDPGLKISCPNGYSYMKDPNDYNSMTCVKLEE
ncbi:MAG: hypothetical protein IJ105_05820 [Bacilli bacterium]|nr:hypothetical protein [Bacilli bacterium]